MAYAKLDVLQIASQLLGYQYQVESDEDPTGKKLQSTLKQAVKSVLTTADWLFAKRLIVLTTDADENNKQYGFAYSFKLPNDLERQIAVYPFYFEKGQTGTSIASSSGMVGFNIQNHNMSTSFGLSEVFKNPTLFNNSISAYRNNPFFQLERIGNNLYSNINKLLLVYISNNIDSLFHEINEYWFIELIAYKLAIMNSYTQSNSNSIDYLEKKYNIKLKNAINENIRLKSLLKNTQNIEIYPFFTND